MPELPEVETVVRTLEKQIRDEEILGVDVRYAKMIEGDAEEFAEALVHEHFRTFERRGKYLIFRMDHVTLVAHLRMEGKFYIMDDAEPLNRHMHVIFQLHNHKQLRYHDTRKFGRMYAYEKKGSLRECPCFARVGKDALDEGRFAAYKKEKLARMAAGQPD